MTVTIALGPPLGAAASGAGAVSAGVSGALSAGLLQAALSARVGISHQLGTRLMENSSRLGNGLRGRIQARVEHVGVEPAGGGGGAPPRPGPADLPPAEEQ